MAMLDNNLLNEIKLVLKQNNVIIASEVKIPYGTRLRLLGGAIINVYDKGKYCFQGKNTENISKLLKSKGL
jgi:predicted nucleotide-binding protein